MISIFKERFKRLLGAGIAGFVLLMAISSFFAYFITSGMIMDCYIELYYFVPVFVFSMLLAMVLVINGFEFLKGRKESDVFHSLPVSRSHMYYGTLLAILCWCAIDIIPIIILVTVITAESGVASSIVLQIAVLWMTALIYTVAVSAFAVVNCGNLIKAGIMMVALEMFPRLAMMIASNYYNSTLKCLIPLPGGIFSEDYNVIVSLVKHLSKVYIDNWNMVGPGTGMTLILTVALVLVGAYCFRKRKSEIAGSEDILKPARYIFNAAVYSIPIAYLSWAPVSYLNPNPYEEPMPGIIIGLVAFIAIFLIVELNYSKKTLKKSAITVSIIFAVFLVSNLAGMKFALNRKIDSSKTKYVQFIRTDYDDGSLRYAVSNMNDTINDKKIIETLEDEWMVDNPEFWGEPNTTIKINNGGFSFYRKNSFYLDTLYDTVITYYGTHRLEFPKNGKIPSSYGLPQNAYKVLQSEMKDKDLMDYLIFEYRAYNKSEEGVHVEVIVPMEGEEVEITLRIDETLPKTFELLQNR